MKTKINVKNLILVLATAVFALVAAATTIYGDDFIYALYFRRGIGEFFSMTYDHYRNMNGRALVHFILEVILIFKDKLFFAVIPGLLVLTYWSGAKLLNVEDKPKFIAISLCLSFFIPYTVMREGVFWMAGAMNYIYPIAMYLIGFYYYVKSAENHKISGITFVFLILGSASTEQGGAALIASAILYAATALGDREKLKVCVKMLVLIFIAYFTVILSPSTFGRAVEETTESLKLIERLRLIYDFSVGRDAPFLIFEASLIIIAVSDIGQRKVLSIFGLAGGALALAFKLYQIYLLSGLCLTASFLVISFGGLMSKDKLRCIITLSALGTIGMLLFSVTFGYRNILPCLLLLIVVSAYETEWFLKNCKGESLVLAGLFVIGFVCFSDIAVGYAKNSVIINENLTSVGDGKSDFYYNTDLNKKYSYNQFFSDKYYTDAWREIYNIDDNVKIYLSGKDFRDLYINGIHCEKPEFIKDGVRYFPLRNVCEAYGCEVSYDEAENLTVIKYQGKTFGFDNNDNILYNSNKETDVADCRLKDREYGYMTSASIYLDLSFYKLIFGTELDI